jgi:hypothetical protein
LERPLPDIEARLKRTLPDSFTINSVEIIPPKAKSLSSSLVLQRLFVEYYPSKVDEFMKKEVVEINAVNVRPAVLEIKKRNDGVEVLMKLGKVKPHQLFQALFNITKDEARLLKVERVGWE